MEHNPTQSRLPGNAIAIVAALIALLSATPRVSAGETSIEAAPMSRSGYVNEVLLIQVRVVNPTQASMPDAPASDAFHMEYSGAPPAVSQTHSIGFNRVESHEVAYTYTYELTPLQAGRIRVGAFTWKDGGRTYQSQPFVITVRDPGESDTLLYARVTASQEKVYVGQQLHLLLEVWVKKYSQPRMGDLDANSMFGRIDLGASTFGAFSEAARSLPRYREDTAPPDEKNGANKSSGNDKDYYVFIWETTDTPRTPGAFDFGAITLACNYPVRLRQSVFFRVEDIQTPRRLRATARLPEVRVLPTPLAGRPDNYNGAVGHFSIEARATPASVPVGDPITLTIYLRSDDAVLEGLSAPKLSAIANLTRDFEVADESLAGEVRGNTKIFSQTIRPLREDIREIPAIPFSYFDPETARYETSWSDPMPLQIRPAERVAVPMDHDAGATPQSLAPLVETTEGLQANHADIDAMLRNQRVTIGVGAYALLGAMPTIYLVGAIATHRSKRKNENAGARRRSRALREARGRLDAAAASQSPRELLGALFGYIADCCDASDSAMTRNEAIDLATREGASAESIARLDQLLQTLEAAQYAGADGIHLRQACSDARELLTRIDSEVQS
ncbi:MAG TPA: BatD family protein [Phycisphaerae bacterium]|nr:BatD family protein [Phycisphaerae bacterium]HRW52053.1 BatD family protein [Phycisphaerae bacterium]